MRIFVTGAGGFIGSHTVNWLKRNHEVFALLHNIHPGKWVTDALAGSHQVLGNVTDYLGLLETFSHYKPDVVVHLAALSIVKGADRDPIAFSEVNVGGTVKVILAAQRAGVKKVVVQSTDKVFGERLDADLADPVSPTETYAASKIAAEMFARTANEGVVICRMSNVYGLDYNDRIIPNTVRACLRGEFPILYEGHPSTRQYLYVDDATAALRYLCEEDVPPIVQIAPPRTHSQKDVILAVLEHFPELHAKSVPAPAMRQIGEQSMKHTLENWRPTTTLREGVARTIEDFKKYREDWDR